MSPSSYVLSKVTISVQTCHVSSFGGKLRTNIALSQFIWIKSSDFLLFS